MCYAVACVTYLFLTRAYGTPFNDSLSDEQRSTKAQSVSKRSCAFAAGVVVGIVLVAAWKPFVRLTGTGT